jgi:hypothetical protein
MASRTKGQSEMTTAEFDRLLTARGWRYDDGEEQFYDGERSLDWEELITVTPECDDQQRHTIVQTMPCPA